jgi:hypothetical protein
MEKAIATNIVEYLSLIKGFGDLQMYRGQGNISWPVMPSLARRVNQFKNCGWDFESWMDVEEHLLDDFRRLSAPWLNFTPQDRFEWLVLAQHHGLPTVLLDMTTNPLKALFFAVENQEHDSFDGVVYGVDPYLGWYTSTSEISTDDEFVFFYSKHINPRIVCQEACFIAFKFPAKLTPFPPLTTDNDGTSDPNSWLDAVLIPKSAKPSLRKELTKLGVTHQSMFPGLDGISKTIQRSLGWN